MIRNGRTVVRKSVGFSFLLGMVLMLTGCFAFPEEVPPLPPPALAVPTVRPFVSFPVSRGDVQVVATPLATYMSGHVESVLFSVNNIPIAGIFVTVGDEVTQGDIIAELYMGEVALELDALNSQRAQLMFDLNQLRARHNLALERAAANEEPVDDQSFMQEQSRLLAELNVLDRRLEYFERENEGRFLYAPISGIVTHAATFVEGMPSRIGQIIATITDQDNTVFVVRAAEADHMSPGDRFEMTLGALSFLMEVVDPDEYGFVRNEHWDWEAFLLFLDVPPTLAPGMSGRVRMVFDEVSDVLYIPWAALNRVEEREFVYVLVDGLRTVREVVSGLEGTGREGNRVVEIVSGLEEGEVVII